MALLFLLSSRSDLDAVPSGWDKVMHAGAYLVLCVLALRAFHGGLHWLGLRQTLSAVLLTVAYGAADELHQAFVAGRHASLRDWVADVLGSVAAIAVVGLFVMVRSRRRITGAIDDSRRQ
jgi:VanZ family protein